MSKWNVEGAFPEEHYEITPSDTVDLPRPMIVVALTDGDVALVDKAGTVIVYTVVAGWISPLMARRVNDTGTDADVVGVF